MFETVGQSIYQFTEESLLMDSPVNQDI